MASHLVLSLAGRYRGTLARLVRGEWYETLRARVRLALGRFLLFISFSYQFIPRQEGGEKPWSRLALVYHPIQVGSIDGTDREPHDRGVVRALRSHYKPDPAVRGHPHCTLFVAHLNPRTTHEQISELFSRAGAVVRCRVVRDAVTGHSKRYAFVEMESSGAAERAHRTLDGETLDNARILVDYEVERSLEGWRPRRLGGGFGGTKESGQLRFGCRRRPFQRPLRPDVHAVDRSSSALRHK